MMIELANAKIPAITVKCLQTFWQRTRLLFFFINLSSWCPHLLFEMQPAGSCGRNLSRHQVSEGIEVAGELDNGSGQIFPRGMCTFSIEIGH
jgi:hypothetical protein